MMLDVDIRPRIMSSLNLSVHSFIVKMVEQMIGGEILRVGTVRI